MATNTWNPQQYDKFKDQRSQPFFDLMALVEPRVEMSVIDLGCGTGELTTKLHAQLGARDTLGIDSSAEMLAKAQLHASANLLFKNQRIEDWAFEGTKTGHPGKSFDLIFSNAAIQWCGGHRDLFRQIIAHLKPGGQLAVQMPMNHDYPTHTLAKQMSREEPWSSLLGPEGYEKQGNMLTIEDYASLLFELGLTQQEVYVRVYGHTLDSREDVIEWVQGTLLTTFQSRLETGDYQRFLAEYRSRLFDLLPDRAPFFYPFKRALIKAQKVPGSFCRSGA